MYYVYIYKGVDERAQIGCTNDFATLFNQQSRPYYFKFSNRETARNFEQYLRSESGRAFIKSHDFQDLYFLANALQYAYEKAAAKLYHVDKEI